MDQSSPSEYFEMERMFLVVICVMFIVLILLGNFTQTDSLVVYLEEKFKTDDDLDPQLLQMHKMKFLFGMTLVCILIVSSGLFGAWLYNLTLMYIFTSVLVMINLMVLTSLHSTSLVVVCLFGTLLLVDIHFLVDLHKIK